MHRPDSRIYVARLERNRLVLFVVDSHSVERLDWGHDAIDLARAVLTEASGFEPTPDVCRRFVQQVLSRVPRDGFALPRDTVNAWLERVVTV